MRQHGVRVLSQRDRELLRFVAEQYLVTLPQLAQLADRCPRTARWLRTRWQRAGLIDGAKLLVDEPSAIWLTRPGLAALGLDWKTVRPSYGSIPTLATLVEVRLAAQEQYPNAGWLSRRVLSHARPVPSPLPDALLSGEQGSVAILAKPRELPRRQLERKVLPLLGTCHAILVVLPEANERTRQWFAELGGHATVLAYRRDQKRVALPRLPTLETLQPTAVAEDDWPMPRPVDPCGDFPHLRTPAPCSPPRRLPERLSSQLARPGNARGNDLDAARARAPAQPSGIAGAPVSFACGCGFLTSCLPPTAKRSQEVRNHGSAQGTGQSRSAGTRPDCSGAGEIES